MVSPLKLLLLLLLPVLVACSDDRASFALTNSDHALTLIREQRIFGSKTAMYFIVAARMPDCMRRHKMGSGGMLAKVEVYSPGNDAWILKQGARMYVVETRTCEGFAKLEAEPEGGMGPLLGVFQTKNGVFTFIAEPKSKAPAAAPAPQVPPSSPPTPVAQ
jgi:hypothetical protein